MASGAQRVRVYVWDPFIRITHWLMVVLLSFSWWAAESREMELHLWSGSALLAVVLFRVYWGLFGTETARFSHFVRGHRSVFAYLRHLFRPSADAASVGHNPLGGWSALLLLGSILLQILLGLFATDVDGFESGPRSYLVSFETGRAIAALHEILFSIIQAAVLLHVGAILFYAFYKRNNLIGPMIVGTRSAPATGDWMKLAARQIRISWPAMLFGLALAALLTWALVFW